MSFNPDRYRSMPYRRCGRSGLLLPAISLGLWQGTGSYVDDGISQKIVHTAFDHGITHFDLANNYGSPAGASESLFGAPGPRSAAARTGHFDQGRLPHVAGSLRRMGQPQIADRKLRAVPQAPRPQPRRHLLLAPLDPDTPIEETMGALETLVRQGKAIYAGISNYADPHFTRAVHTMRERNWAPITIHQPSYSMLNRAPEREVRPPPGAKGSA